MARADQLTGEIKAPSLYEITDDLAVLFEADAELRELEASLDPFADDGDEDATKARMQELTAFIESAWGAVDELGPKVDGYLYRRDQLLAEADGLLAAALAYEEAAKGIRAHASELTSEADSLLDRLVGVMRRFGWVELKGLVRRIKWQWNGGVPKLAVVADKDELCRKAFVAGLGRAEVTVKAANPEQLKALLSAFDATPELQPVTVFAVDSKAVIAQTVEDKSQPMARTFIVPDWLDGQVEVSRGGKAVVS